MSSDVYIGLSTGVHDPALAIVDSAGEPLFAEARERSSQCKRGYNLPADGIHDIEHLLQTYAADAERIVLATSWSGQSLTKGRWLRRFAEVWEAILRARGRTSPDLAALRSLLYRMPESDSQSALNLELRLSEREPRDLLLGLRRTSWDHHLCHAAAACYASPFPEAVCAVIDGAGEHGSTAFYHYTHGALKRLDPIPGYFSYHSASLGHFYGDLCWACGFDTWKGEEWKVMGLAAYGKLDSELHTLLRPMLRAEGLRLRHCPDFAARRAILRGYRGRPAMDCADLAFTGQRVFEEVLFALLQELWRRLPCTNLVLCGGCALNSSANGNVLGNTPFQSLFVPSAPADDGNALGAAWLAKRADHPSSTARQAPLSPYLGTGIHPTELDRLEAFCPLPMLRLDPADVARRSAELLAQGKILGWFQGRAEWGPRALGNRSILADPRRPEIHERLNAQVKFREAFRPFAPSILHDAGPGYFETYQESPYMERTLRFREERRAEVPGVVHVDGTGRLQSVRATSNPRFHDLLREFHRLTGVPILLNTSLNVMGKPIVHSLADAISVIMLSGLDGLVIEDRIILKPDPAGRNLLPFPGS